MRDPKLYEKIGFTAAFCAAVAGIDRDVACKNLKISRSTFDRWLNGFSRPVVIAQPSIFATLRRLRATK